jgi:hypothetical protein
MKQFARSVPVILFMSFASLSLIALAGCSGGSGTIAPAAAKSIYAIQSSSNSTTGIEQDSMLVFSASATGSATPTSTLALPSGFFAYSIAVGAQGVIYVGGQQGSGTEYGVILEYPAGSSGSATPNVTLNGSSAGTATFTWPDEIAVSSEGKLFVSSDDGSLETFASGFSASSVPTQYLTWGENNFDDIGEAIGVDTAGDVFYADDDAIDVFAAGATGATAPTRTITGTDTNSFEDLFGMAVDGAGDVYVTNYNPTDDPAFPFARTNPGTSAASKRAHTTGPRAASRLTAHPHEANATFEPTEIIEFAAGATGNAMPLKRIGGAATKIVEPFGLALDAVSNLYYADANDGYFTESNPAVLLEVFPSSATGNAGPAASLTSTSFTFDNAVAVAIH